MMTTTYPTPEETRFSSKPERSAARTRDFGPDDRSVRAEAEEEMMAALWAADPGNQGG
jgi:hypothetical protein